MTDRGPETTRARPKRRVHVLDTIAARAFVWLALTSALVAPIAILRPHAPQPPPRASTSAAPPAQIAPPALTPAPASMLPAPTPQTPSPTISASASVAPSAIVPSHAGHAPNLGQVRARLAAILSAYQNRDDFGTPESATQAANALHWCAQQLADHEHISAPDASSALSAALVEPRSPEGVRVVSAIEASAAEGGDDTSRMHCASLLYAQFEH